ncbi:hypothetical protein HG530_015437 [Fusarium avenaceum]|nr:hypothetical protein HG530_015437 [Fusarium avenaceum]
MLDISITSEDTLEVNPLTLNINPNIEKHMDAVKFVLPRHCFFFKLFVVIPTANETDFVLIADHLQSIVLPRLADLLQELLQSHLALSLSDDVLHDDFSGDQVEIPNITKGHRARRKSFLWLDLFIDLDPMALTNGIRLQVRENRIDLEEATQNTLDVLKSSILTHSAGHVLGTFDEIINLGTNLSRLNSSPENIARLIKAGPDSGEI